MKPGIIEWADNAVWAGGPSFGSATKAPPTTAERNEGYYPTQRPAPQILNYLMNELSQRARGAASMRLLNWIEIDATAIADTGGPMDGVHDPITGSDVTVDFTGAAAFEDNVAPGGMIWAAGAGGAGMSGANARIACDHLGNIAFVNDILCPPGLLAVAYSPTPLGGWVAWPGGGAPAGQWSIIEHDHLGRWVIGDYTALAVHLLTSTAPANAFGACAAAPGFIAGQGPSCLKHSHHPAGSVWPADPGNQAWIALSLTEQSRSANGTNWTAAAVHAMGSLPVDLAYSRFGTTWITILLNGQIGTSTDNGATWTVTNPLAASALGALTGARIACDGYGDWVIAMTDGAGGAVEVWASWDNGASWSMVFLTSAPHPNDIALWYGGGRFHLMSTDAAAAWAGYASLRADE
jgi:hypothetical protein